MGEIAFPQNRTFFKTADGGGFTDIDQVTSSGDPAFQSASDTTTLFPALPSTGRMITGTIYSYNGGMVIVEQDHDRTIYAPEDTPTLFSVYRANTDNMDWVENEQVIKGDKRNYGSKKYQCIQPHQTLEGMEPDITPALWKEVVEGIGVWKQPTGAHDAYNIGDKVHFPTISDPVYESLIDANVWSPIVYPAGWKKI
jgi:hypothetical protein